MLTDSVLSDSVQSDSVQSDSVQSDSALLHSTRVILAVGESHSSSLEIWRSENRVRSAWAVLRQSSGERVLEMAETLLQEPALVKSLSTLFSETSLLALFTESGIPGDRGFFGDLSHAIVHRFLPKSVVDRDLDEFLQSLFPNLESGEWPSSVSESVWKRVLVQVRRRLGEDTEKKSWSNWEQDVLDGLELLSHLVTTVGHSPVLRSYVEKAVPAESRRSFQESPFSLVQKSIRVYLDSESLDSIETALLRVDDCKQFLERLEDELEKSGVSVDVVFRLQQLRTVLQRIEDLLRLKTNPQFGFAQWVLFVAILLQQKKRDLDPLSICKMHLNFLAKKITEHAGATGEHYITSGFSEYRKMFWSACGAGVFTALTCYVKAVISASGMPPLIETFFVGSNYALSFLILQHFGLSLATKQSSMTAAYLAQSIEKGSVFLDLTARITRSQFVAALGNVCAVIPAALFVDLMVRHFTGGPILSAEKAEKTLAAFSALGPSVYIFAAITGCLLWLSSLVSGWVENFSIYHRLPAVFERKLFKASRRIPLLGRHASGLSLFFKKHVRGWGGNVSLGYLLALPVGLGRLLGMSWDVRHVTLGAGTVAIASSGLLLPKLHLGAGFVASLKDFHPQYLLPVGFAFLGVLFVGFLNVFVSFLLSLSLAIASRHKSPWIIPTLLRQVLKDIVSGPGRYLFPALTPKGPSDSSNNSG